MLLVNVVRKYTNTCVYASELCNLFKNENFFFDDDKRERILFQRQHLFVSQNLFICSSFLNTNFSYQSLKQITNCAVNFVENKVQQKVSWTMTSNHNYDTDSVAIGTIQLNKGLFLDT